jgi:hypothetical protein
MLGGEDEIDFALEVIERTGKTFLAVNMFTDSDERIVNAAKSCTTRLRSEGNRTKLDDEIYLVNSKQAFEGYRLNDANKVRQSGIQKLERRLAAFIINGAYLAKVRSAVDGAVTLVSVLKEELSRVRVALIADQKEFISALDSGLEQAQNLDIFAPPHLQHARFHETAQGLNSSGRFHSAKGAA